MVGLLILKQLHNLSDEQRVATWVQNPYFQAFCGEQQFQWQLPCDPSDLTWFRKRIGVPGVEKVFAQSVMLHGERAREAEVCIDTTVQEKNITFPTDAIIRLPTESKLPERLYRRPDQPADGSGCLQLQKVATAAFFVAEEYLPHFIFTLGIPS